MALKILTPFNCQNFNNMRYYKQFFCLHLHFEKLGGEKMGWKRKIEEWVRKEQDLPKYLEDKGRLAENKVRKVLEELKQVKKINGYHQTDPYSPLDNRGIDFLIFNKENLTVALQVKTLLSPEIKERLHLKQVAPGIWLPQKGNIIYHIEVGWAVSKTSVRAKILKILKIERERLNLVCKTDKVFFFVFF